jgi:uncharacterized 2Fe-2S/4Fe-4S cluster protein (DUF4445 family)
MAETNSFTEIQFLTTERCSLLEAIRNSGNVIYSSCGGRGHCGKCRVKVLEGEITPPDENELRLLSSKDIAQNVRLACRAFVKGTARLQINRIAELSLIYRDDIQYYHFPEISVKPDYVPGHAPFGLSIDLGTTKIASCLLDRRTAQILESAYAFNPQMIYGGDIMSRLNASLSGQAQALSRMVYRKINQMLIEMCRRAGIETDQIGAVCIVGNTAMIHLLTGRPVDALANAPYRPDSLAQISLKAAEAGLKVAQDAWLYIPAGVGGFVGSDHLAMIVGAGIDKSDKIMLGIDIGTNTEIVLCHPAENRVVCLSAPSGPAFEGAQISCGMLAGDGAIRGVYYKNGRFQLECTGKPTGICGSGLVQAAAECYRTGIINHRGRINAQGNCVVKSPSGNSVALFWEDEDHSKALLTLTQADFDALLLAKGAIQAGIELLIDHTRIFPDDIETCVLAGAFGNYLDLTSGVSIGMLPNIPLNRFHFEGNAAMKGAVQFLLSSHMRRQSELLAKNIVHVEMNSLTKFKHAFANAIYLPHQR